MINIDELKNKKQLGEIGERIAVRVKLNQLINISGNSEMNNTIQTKQSPFTSRIDNVYWVPTQMNP